MASKNISRDVWLTETEAKCRSNEEAQALVELEQFIVKHTGLLVTYRRNPGGISHFATFNGSVDGHCSVIQINNGECHLIWKWKNAIPGLMDEQHQRDNEAFDEFRQALGGREQSWQKIPVLDLGLTRIQDALRLVSEKLHTIIR